MMNRILNIVKQKISYLFDIGKIKYWLISGMLVCERFRREVFKYNLFWGGFVVGCIMVYCFYEISIEHLRMLVYNSYIYPIPLVFIIGLVISKIISLNFSQFNFDKGENNKNVKNTSIIITVIVILLISIVENVELGFDLNQNGVSANEASTSENLNNVDLSVGDGVNFISSLLDCSLSQLELLINCGILTNIMILNHINLLVLILIEKYNVQIFKQSSVGFISKFVNKYKYKLNKLNKLNKIQILQKFINIYRELFRVLNNKYFSQWKINVIIILFYVCFNVYINIELSSNLNDYVYIYNKLQIKEGGIWLLLLNCNIKNKYVSGNRLEKRLFSSSNVINSNSNSNKNNNRNRNSNSISNSSNINHLVEKEKNIMSKYNNIIFPNICNLSNKQKPKPLMGGVDIIKESPDLKELNKQNFFPLTHLHLYRKESLLTETSTAYLNSVHPTKLRVNLNKTPSPKFHGLTVAPPCNWASGPLQMRIGPLAFEHRANEMKCSNTSDVIYEYLKTFSNYSHSKKGVLINFNQHIAYNFNKKNLLLRGVEPIINNYLKLKINKNKSTNAVPFTNSFQLEKAKVAKSTENINKNININYHLNKPLLGIYPESKKFTPRVSFANTHRTEEPSLAYEQRANALAYEHRANVAPAGLHLEIPQDLQLRLNRLNSLKGVSGETGYNRKGNNRLIKYSYKILFNFFKSIYCLISKPVFIFTPDKVVIQLQYFLNIPKFKVFKLYSKFKYKKILQKWEARINKNKKNNKRFNWKGRRNSKRNKKIHWKVARTLIRLNNKETKVKNILFNLNKYNLFRVFSLKFKLICDILNNKFNKPVELQLIRIHKPYQDSNILVNLLSLNIRNKKFKTNVQIEKLFQKRIVKIIDDPKNKSVNLIPTYLSGLKIRIGGRLMREPLIPRLSKKRFERGASSVGKVNFLDTASITNKNRKGSYTLKILSGQNFF